MTFKQLLLKASPLLVLALVGVVVIALNKDDTAALIVGGGLEALAGIGIMSLLFYEVGRSEDRAREAEERARRR